MRRPWVASLALLLGCGPGRRAPAALGELRCDDLSPPALTAASLPELLQMARSLHPELADARIELVPSRSETVFFRADVKPGTLFGRRSRRIYRVHHSVALTDDPPPPQAVLAILDHELEHVRHYTTMASLPLVGFGLDYAVGGTATYERFTDEHPLRAGCGEGLAQYRAWLYERISPRVEAKKRRTYVTPDEARAWTDDGTAPPDAPPTP